MNEILDPNDPQLQPAIAALREVRAQLAQVIVGQEQTVELALIALLCEGHVLFEGVPGLGKTLLVRSLAETLGLYFSRIQFTPDLMPADVLGSTVIEQDQHGNYALRFEPGSVFSNLVLADEINRASPKTQSALLEAMQERAVTIRGQRHALPRPFQVLATQNPLEMEGTYPLPEAQIDRFFFKVLVAQPDHSELVTILERTVGPTQGAVKLCLDAAGLATLQTAVREVVAPPPVVSQAARLVLATQPEREGVLPEVARLVRYGAGPRGAQALLLAAKARALMNGRGHAGIEDLHALLEPALRHRIALNFDGLSEGLQVDSLLDAIRLAVTRDKTWRDPVRASAN